MTKAQTYDFCKPERIVSSDRLASDMELSLNGGVARIYRKGTLALDELIRELSLLLEHVPSTPHATS